MCYVLRPVSGYQVTGTNFTSAEAKNLLSYCISSLEALRLARDCRYDDPKGVRIYIERLREVSAGTSAR